MSAARYGEARGLALDNMKKGGDPQVAVAAAILALAEATLEVGGAVSDGFTDLSSSVMKIADAVSILEGL